MNFNQMVTVSGQSKPLRLLCVQACRRAQVSQSNNRAALNALSMKIIQNSNAILSPSELALLQSAVNAITPALWKAAVLSLLTA